MVKKKVDMPESVEQDEALQSSDALPDWDNVDQRYEELFGGYSDVESKSKGKKIKENVIEQPAIPEGFDAQMIESVVCMIPDMIFARKQWPVMTEVERKTWSESIANLFNKYFPMLAKWNVELAPVLCVLGMISVRMDWTKFWSKFNVGKIPKSNSDSVGSKGNRQDNVDIQTPQ